MQEPQQDSPQRGRTRKRNCHSSATPPDKTQAACSAPSLRPPLLSLSDSSSGRRSRSRSLVRTTLNALKSSFPRIQSYQPKDNTTAVPQHVGQARRLLLEDAGVGVVPHVLREQLQELDIVTQEDTPSAAFGDVEFGTKSTAEVWHSVQKIYRSAQECELEHQDEMAWTGVVRAVLELAMAVEEHDSLCPQLQLKEIQNQSIHDRFLPRHRTNNAIVLARRKTDFALGFSKSHPQTAPIVHAATASGSHDTIALSHMTDSHTSTIPLACPVEVKREGGDSLEALLQLTVWQAAAFMHLRYLRADLGESLDAVLTGWTIVGHDWGLFLTWSVDKSELNSRGPYRSPAMGTDSYLSIFTLLEVLRRIIRVLKGQHRELLLASMQPYIS